jgi:hypothetical protein
MCRSYGYGCGCDTVASLGLSHGRLGRCLIQVTTDGRGRASSEIQDKEDFGNVQGRENLWND